MGQVSLRKVVELMVDRDRDYDSAMLVVEESKEPKHEKETIFSWIIGRMLHHDKKNKDKDN